MFLELEFVAKSLLPHGKDNLCSVRCEGGRERDVNPHTNKPTWVGNQQCLGDTLRQWTEATQERTKSVLAHVVCTRWVQDVAQDRLLRRVVGRCGILMHTQDIEEARPLGHET